MGLWRRHAIYFAPPAGSPLAAFGAAWLGWDAATGAVPAHQHWPDLPHDRAALTEAPRRYGFHATLKPPFRLAPDTTPEALDAATAALARTHPSFTLTLRVAALGPFLALLADAPPELSALADACVTTLDRFRAPPAPEELARRQATGLDSVEAANLARWGYPYVLDRFLFHMTLTGPLPASERPALQSALADTLAPLLAAPVPVTEICRFSEAADGRFRLVRRFPLAPANPAP